MASFVCSGYPEEQKGVDSPIFTQKLPSPVRCKDTHGDIPVHESGCRIALSDQRM